MKLEKKTETVTTTTYTLVLTEYEAQVLAAIAGSCNGSKGPGEFTNRLFTEFGFAGVKSLSLFSSEGKPLPTIDLFNHNVLR